MYIYKYIYIYIYIYISFKQLPLSYFTTLTCRSLLSVSYCQSRESRVYLQQMIIDSTREIGELMVLLLAAFALYNPLFLLLLKSGALPNSDLKF